MSNSQGVCGGNAYEVPCRLIPGLELLHFSVQANMIEDAFNAVPGHQAIKGVSELHNESPVRQALSCAQLRRVQSGRTQV